MSALDAWQSTSQRLTDNGLGESVHVFGDGLIGVLHRGATPTTPTTPAMGDVAMIVLNAGLVHRVGPFRGSVQLARALASSGVAVFRFDQSGLGDSPISKLGSAERRQNEMRAAIDLVAQQTGARRFIVGGICSAADDAFDLASGEPRIKGLLLLDGLSYRTIGYWWRYLLPRVFNPVKVWRWLRKFGAPRRPDMADFRTFPKRRDAAARLAGMVERDVRLLFVFTGGAYLYFNHPGQLAASLGAAARAPQVSMEYWPQSDHTFYLQRDRVRLQDAVAAWLQQVFGDGR